MTSPTTFAHLRCFTSAVRFCCHMVNRIRRCTGFKPSRTSGSARDVMTDSA
jgi:hypothetical protein